MTCEGEDREFLEVHHSTHLWRVLHPGFLGILLRRNDLFHLAFASPASNPSPDVIPLFNVLRVLVLELLRHDSYLGSRFERVWVVRQDLGQEKYQQGEMRQSTLINCRNSYTADAEMMVL